MINKSDSRCAVVRFCYHSHDYRPNWTPLSPISITNSLEHYAISGNIVCGIKNHLPNFLIITKLSNPLKNFKLYKRDYSRLDNDMLNYLRLAR